MNDKLRRLILCSRRMSVLLCLLPISIAILAQAKSHRLTLRVVDEMRQPLPMTCLTTNAETAAGNSGSTVLNAQHCGVSTDYISLGHQAPISFSLYLGGDRLEVSINQLK